MTAISKTKQIYNYTANKLAYLNSLTDTGAGRGILAILRRGVGKKPGELPELWGFIFERIPEDLLGNENKGASYAEWAIYTALTLYALHQQGNEKPMNVKGVSLGEAAAKLARLDNDNGERVVKRLNLVATAVSQNDLAYYLRAVVQLLKAAEIPLDYAKLAREIYLMNFEESAKDVTLSWGRKFYSVLYEYEKETKNDEQ